MAPRSAHYARALAACWRAARRAGCCHPSRASITRQLAARIFLLAGRASACACGHRRCSCLGHPGGASHCAVRRACAQRSHAVRRRGTRVPCAAISPSRARARAQRRLQERRRPGCRQRGRRSDRWRPWRVYRDSWRSRSLAEQPGERTLLLPMSQTVVVQLPYGDGAPDEAYILSAHHSEEKAPILARAFGYTYVWVQERK